MNRSQLLAVVLAGAAILTGVTFAAAPATAAGDGDSVLSGVFSDDSDNEDESLLGAGYDASMAGLSGGWDRAKYAASQYVPAFVSDTFPSLSPDEKTAAGQADALETYYESNNETLETYVNERENFTDDHTVVVTLHLNGETATRYLLANASNGNVSTTVVSTTDRTPDENLKLCGFAAASAHEELQHFTEEYARPNEDVDTSYLARLKGRYSDDVQTSLYPSGGDCSGGD